MGTVMEIIIEMEWNLMAQEESKEIKKSNEREAINVLTQFLCEKLKYE